MSGRWPLERVLFALAGTMVALSVLLTATVSGWFLAADRVRRGQPVAVQPGRVLPASLVLRRAGVERGCRW